jgi:arginyl-tRNA synthetase
MKKSPVQIAKEFANKIKPSGSIKEIKAIGPYLNFFINKQGLAKDILKEILEKKENFGSGEKKHEKIMVEYVSPNTNKSLHLGHVRNGLLGTAVSNVLQFNGYKVIKASLNNDRGIGMCEAMLGYKMFHNNEKPAIKPDHFVAQCYVDFKKAEKEKPELEEEAKKLLVEWEAEKPSVRKLWKKLTKWVYKGYKQTSKDLDFTFDKEYYESQIYKEGKEIVNEGLKKGIFEIKEGAVTAILEPYNLPNKVLIKSDGTSLYMTQDLYLAQLKEKEFQIDRSVYVVASEQDNHFRQLFKILELLGFKSGKKCHHLSYGLVNLPSGRMKSREGTVVDADDLIAEVTKLAREEVVKRHPELKEREISKRSRIIGLGALKFFMLKFDNITSFVYNPEESLSFEGETGPYVQYAHARICSILSKYNKAVNTEADLSKLNTPYDEKLIVQLGLFKEVIEKAANDYRPHLIARYLIELAQSFNEFYHQCPILQAEEDVKKARLVLISAVKQILKNGLNLLGIEAPEKM